MKWLANIEVSLCALAVNKIRSGLTMLGIIIGISAVIVLVSVGQGVQTMVTHQMEKLGSNLLFIMPGELENNSSMKSNFLRSSNISSLSMNDAMAIANSTRSAGVVMVAPEYVGTATVVHGSNNTQTTVSGVTGEYAAVLDFEPILGRFVEGRDLDANARVVVLGQTVLNELFPIGINPIGQTIKIDRVSFRIIGIMEKKGGTAFSDQDDAVFVPLTTAQSRLFGGRLASGEYAVSVIYVQAASESRMDPARDQIARLLRKRHGLIYGTDKDDFSILTQADISAVVGNLTSVLTAFLGLIAAVSLLVGGIGIMNIMLVSVTERTREIGIRKAVGAKKRDILLQFLTEAMTLSLIGGLLGILLGIAGSIAVSEFVDDLSTFVSANTVFLSAGFSMTVGLFFGIYPAMRAARLDPIESLRYE
jgi:putative ABC transport system permease protein